MEKTANNKAWLLALPVLVVVALISIVPLLIAAGYAVHDLPGPYEPVFVGAEWFAAVLRDPWLHSAFLRQITFTACVLAIEVPLGVAVALAMPVRGFAAAFCIVILALPLVVPWGVVGTIWRLFAHPDIGLGGALVNGLGFAYDYSTGAIGAWITVLIMDVWHWTPLVALLCHAGLRAISDAHYQAARIDGASAWAVFRHVELPAMYRPLMIAVVFRLLDSLAIYAEPFALTGGGPDGQTGFLSQFLAELAVSRSNTGDAGAFSVLYFLLILPLALVCYRVLASTGKGETR